MRKSLLAGLLITLAACGGGGAPGASATSDPAGPNRPAARARATKDYQLSWQPITRPDVTGYRLYYAQTPFDAAADGQLLATATTPEYVVKMAALEVAQGSTLFFAVSAIYGADESALSQPVSVTVK